MAKRRVEPKPATERERNPVAYVVRRQQLVERIIARQMAHTARKVAAELDRRGL